MRAFSGFTMPMNLTNVGRDFERLLTDLFTLFDMEPRLAYNLDYEQIER
jgi:hypothetical protein